MILDEADDHFIFVGNDKIFRFLSERHIYFNFDKSCIPGDGTRITVSKDNHPEPFVCFHGRPFVGGFGFVSYTNSTLNCNVKVGRYCSIAAGVQVIGDSHPLDRITTHTITYQKFASIHTEPSKFIGGTDMKPSGYLQKAMPVIEDDVWIGTNAVLNRGITIGAGAVVAAHSVVTKDVPPYAVVGGNPAKVLRFRFEEPLIKEMLRVRWWRFAYPHFSDLPFKNPWQFLEMLEKRLSNDEISEYNPVRINIYQILKQEFGL